METLRLFSLEGRRALVTGSSRGIGLALARGLAGAGAAVILNGRDLARLDAAVAGLRRDGLTVEAIPGDVSDGATAEAAIARAEEAFGPVDILVNNAGLQHRATLFDFDEAAFDRVVASHLKAAFLMGRAAARRMAERGAGRIVNVCSVLSLRARAHVVPYAAAKAGLANLTRGMATEWAPLGINVNAIAPGYFRTELTAPLVDDPSFNTWIRERVPMQRWGELDDLIGATVFLAAEASRFVNGHLLVVDGGLTATL